MLKFGQVKPFRPILSKREPQALAERLTSLRQFVAVQRLPLLAVGSTTEPSQFVGFERGHRGRLVVRARNSTVYRAALEDAYILAYVTTKEIKAFDYLCATLGTVEIKPEIMLQEMGRKVSASSIAELIGGLRRIHMTQVSVENWGPRGITESGPLLEVTPNDDRTTFHASTPDWLDDEIHANRIIRVTSEELKYTGALAVLLGWAKGRVGRKLDDHRMITRAEALNRAGAFPPGSDYWTEISNAVAANDVPGFDFDLTMFNGQAAIIVRPAAAATVSPREFDENNTLTLEGFDDDQTTASSDSEIILFEDE